MKSTLYIILVLLLLTTVNAAHYTQVPINISFSVDFQNERDFRLLMEGGFERHFYWEANQTHTDASFTHTVYRNLDEDEWCVYTLNTAGDYRNISLRMNDMLGTCSGIIGNLNKTEDYLTQIAKAKSDLKDYELMWKVCEQDRKEAINKTAEYKDEYNKYKTNYDDCDANVRSLRNSNAGYQQCKDDLAE